MCVCVRACLRACVCACVCKCDVFPLRDSSLKLYLDLNFYFHRGLWLFFTRGWGVTWWSVAVDEDYALLRVSAVCATPPCGTTFNIVWLFRT